MDVATFQEGTALNTNLAELVGRIDRDLRGGGPAAYEVAKSVKSMLRTLEPTELVTGLEAKGAEEGYAQHCVHRDPDGRFSVVLLVWKAGQCTPIHSHRSWGVVSVLEGLETETVYNARGPIEDLDLQEAAARSYVPGQVMFFNPPV